MLLPFQQLAGWVSLLQLHQKPYLGTTFACTVYYPQFLGSLSDEVMSSHCSYQRIISLFFSLPHPLS